MGSFVSLKDFVRDGGHGAVILSLRSVAPVLEVKQASLDDAATGFELRLRDLAAENWSVIASIFAGAGVSRTTFPTPASPTRLRASARRSKESRRPGGISASACSMPSPTCPLRSGHQRASHGSWRARQPATFPRSSAPNLQNCDNRSRIASRRSPPSGATARTSRRRFSTMSRPCGHAPNWPTRPSAPGSRRALGSRPRIGSAHISRP